MKKNFLLIAIAAVVSVVSVVLVARNNKAATKKAIAIELTEFEAWKASHEKTAVVKKSAPRKINYQSPKMVSESQNTAKAKKGWSKAAKGAVIGGASGAILGAVINKRNRAAGAVIGGVIGGGGGYVLGRRMDKKDGRF